MKISYLRDLIIKKEVGMVCLHKTNCSMFSKESCCYLWGSNKIDWVENSAVNNAEEIITMWRRSSFNMTSYFYGKFFSVIEGVWKVGVGVQITIVTMYSFGSLKERKEVWDEIC